MTKSEILSIFLETGVPISAQIVEHLDREDYDDYESWCCGLEARKDENGNVLVAEYCRRGRGGDKALFCCHPDGNWEKIGDGRPASNGRWIFGGDEDDEAWNRATQDSLFKPYHKK